MSGFVPPGKSHRVYVSVFPRMVQPVPGAPGVPVGSAQTETLMRGGVPVLSPAPFTVMGMEMSFLHNFIEPSRVE